MADCDASEFHRPAPAQAKAHRKVRFFKEKKWIWLQLCTPCATRFDWEPAYIMDRVPTETIQKWLGVGV